MDLQRSGLIELTSVRSTFVIDESALLRGSRTQSILSRKVTFLSFLMNVSSCWLCRGVQIVHYLMFSDHAMVRRAAAEVMCNIAATEELFKLLRQPDKVRLWLALSEEWDKETNPEEAYLTARAAAGTLAIACSDEDVCKAMIAEGCASTIVALLDSEKPELIHRGLVIILSGCQAAEASMARHLVQGGVISSIASTANLGDETLVSLAGDAAEELSKHITSNDTQIDTQ